MFKKLTLTLLITSISLSLVGMQISKVIDAENLIQESYNNAITSFKQLPGISTLVPEKSINGELTQMRLISFLGSLYSRSIQGITAIAFYNDTKNSNQQIKDLKKLFEEQTDTVYLLTANIEKTEQEIKDIFNITTEPTLIYYDNGEETARSTNFQKEEVLQYIKENLPENIVSLSKIAQEIELPENIQEDLSKNAPELATYISPDSTDEEKSLWCYLSQEKKPVIVKFSANWCPPCKMMKPIVKEIAEKYSDKVIIINVTADTTTQHLLQALAIQTIPTFVFFKNGKVVDRAQFMSKDEFIEKIEKLEK